MKRRNIIPGERLTAEAERDAALASAAALREALAKADSLASNIIYHGCGELTRRDLTALIEAARAALADNAGAALLERLHAAERRYDIAADVALEWERKLTAAEAENGRVAAELENATRRSAYWKAEHLKANDEVERLAAQLLLDGPLAALARRYVEECDGGGYGTLAGAEMIRLARKQKGGAK